jgi:hypothetical protein
MLRVPLGSSRPLALRSDVEAGNFGLGPFSNLRRTVPLGIDYLLLLIVLSTSVATAPIPTRIGHFHSLENCMAAANDAKATQPINPATFGFICVRDNDLPIARPR